MKRTEPPSQEEFDSLLAWLDPDRERAGEKYEEIRRKLTKILVWRQCYDAEELADETINRVSHRAQDIAIGYVGDPATYFCGVMKNVYLEWLKDKGRIVEIIDSMPLPSPDPNEDEDRIYEYLERCRQELEAEDSELILKYYQQEKRAKIDQRKGLADRLGITLNTLRMRVHRIKAMLQQCVGECLKQSEV